MRPADIYEKLERRGIQPGRIKQVVLLNQPREAFFFALHFGNRTIKQVLEHIEWWKQALKGEFLLPDDLKANIAQSMRATEDFVWGVIRENNARIGNWDIRWCWLPTASTGPADGEAFTGMQVKAANLTTGEVRTHELSPRKMKDARRSELYQEAFKALGLSDELWLGAPRPFLISCRDPRGWPLFTRWVIPPLYELLAPAYTSQGHYSETTDNTSPHLRRSALYPKELLEDMLELLRTEHPGFFKHMTIAQLKAALQRHVSRTRLGGLHNVSPQYYLALRRPKPSQKYFRDSALAGSR